MNNSIDTFPNAPGDWDPEQAESTAAEQGLTLTDDHWELVRALQEYYSKVERANLRQIKDALEEKFHAQGGVKYLYEIIPGGPVALGCKLAGLDVPAGSIDPSFGSVA